MFYQPWNHMPQLDAFGVLLVVVLFAVISFAYFFVPVTQGKILYRHDASPVRF